MKTAYAYITALALLAGCGSSETPVDTNVVRDEGSITTTNYRLCSKEFNSITQSALSGFFGKIVSGLEGPVTYCLDISGSGIYVDGSFRVEYEDNAGIRVYKTKPEYVWGGEIKIGDTTSSVEIIFYDPAGFIQIKGTVPNSTGILAATVKYSTLPSYEDALDAKIEEAKNKCKNGTYTVAQCLGYNFPPVYWWNAPSPTSQKQAAIDEAKRILNDPTKMKTLGTISVDVSSVLK